MLCGWRVAPYSSLSCPPPFTSTAFFVMQSPIQFVAPYNCHFCPFTRIHPVQAHFKRTNFERRQGNSQIGLELCKAACTSASADTIVLATKAVCISPSHRKGTLTAVIIRRCCHWTQIASDDEFDKTEKLLKAPIWDRQQRFYPCCITPPEFSAAFNTVTSNSRVTHPRKEMTQCTRGGEGATPL